MPLLPMRGIDQVFLPTSTLDLDDQHFGHSFYCVLLPGGEIHERTAEHTISKKLQLIFQIPAYAAENARHYLANMKAENPDAVWKNKLIYDIIHPSHPYHTSRVTIDSGI